jgi:DNA invertase Pin-like site-specific DNA recombinase
MRTAIYARISTNTDKQDLDTQIMPLTEYCQSRGWKVTETYTDEMSGSKEKRPALDKLMKDAHRRKFDCVLVFRFDRFSRSTKQLINSLETFRSLGVHFVSYQEAVDTSTPAGQMMFTMISAFAQFERSIIQERVKAGLAKARAKGKKLGRPKVEIDVAAVRAMRSEGMSLRAIGKKLGVSKSLVAKWV